MRIPLTLALGTALAACGGGGGGDPDAPPANPPDAMPQHVRMVACTGTPPTVTTPGSMYSPASVTIAVDGQVHFMLATIHNVVSTTPGQVFSLPFGADTCLEFDAAGTYTFKCQPHSFTGTVVVQ